MFHIDIKKLTLENDNFRKVIYTGKNSQLVLMSIPVAEEIGEEVHPDVDQILFLVSGIGEAVLEGKSSEFKTDEVVFVPAGTKHNFINKGDTDLKLYTVYSPPEHPDGTVHKTKAEAQQSEESNVSATEKDFDMIDITED